MSQQFNPHSTDAMFATVLLRLETQDKVAEEWRIETKKTLDEIRAEVKKTNGRVTSLERFKASMKAKAFGVAFGVSALSTSLFWIFSHRAELSAAIRFLSESK